MPYVHIHMLKRGLAAKKAVSRAVTSALVKSLKIPADYVHVIFHEMTEQDNAIAGELLSDRKKKTNGQKKT